MFKGLAAVASVVLASISTSAFSQVQPPTLDKAFIPTTVSSGQAATLRFTVTNPAGAPVLVDVGFVDTLPSGLRIAAAPNVGGTCANAAAATTANAGTTTITVTNLQVGAGATSCTVTVDVSNATGQFNPSCAGNPAAFTNDGGSVTVSNVAKGALTSCLVVTPPTVDKTFLPTSIDADGTSTLRFTITNPAGGPVLNNVGFSDNLPSGLRIAAAPNVGGTCANAAAATTAPAGGGAITVTALQVTAGASSCTVTVDVTNAAGQFNPSCAGNPPAFTNDGGSVTVSNVAKGSLTSCLAVIGPVVVPVGVPAVDDGLIALMIALVGLIAISALRTHRKDAA